MDALLQDLRFGFRNLVKSPGFSAAALVSLALGIGANAAIFSVVNAVLLRDLPFRDPDRLVVIWETNRQLGVERTGPSGATFLDWRERSRSFEDMTFFQVGSATITGLEEPEQVPGMRVTVNFFDILGYEPALGRDFLPTEARGGRADVAIVSHDFWQRAWGGRSEVLGSQLMGDHIPYTLTGVLPPDFWYPLRTDLFVPWDEAELGAMSRWAREFAVIGRLAPGVTMEQARAEMSAIAEGLAAEYAEQEGWGVEISTVREETTAFIRPALLVVLGAVAFVLLIACTNVANLLLARATSRHREMAIRAATGASRVRLLRQLLTESALLSIGGGALGLLVGYLGLQTLRALLPSEIPLVGANGAIMLPAVDMDARVLLFTAAVALLTAVLFGILPAWQTSLADLSGALKQADRGAAGTSRRGGRALNTLVAGEIALAVVLLAGTVLMVQTLWNLSRVDLGFDPSGLLSMQIEVPTDSRYGTDDEQAVFYRQVLEELRALPGVESVGISEILPLDNAQRRIDFRRSDDDLPVGAPGIGVDYNLADAGFFETLRVPLVRGRPFNDTDDRDHRQVVLIDTTFAAAYFPGRDPIGEQIEIWRLDFEIVGIIGPIRNAGIDTVPRPTVYVSYLQHPDNLMSFVLRSAGDPASLTQAAKEAVWVVDPEQPLFNVRPMDSVVAQGASSRRLTSILLGIFSGLALMMAAFGVYGVMSYAVGQRTRELGLRQALGANRSKLLGMIVREGAAITVFGIAIGTVAALAIGTALSSLLYGVSASQPLVFVLVGALLFTVSAAATLVPALRASSVDPMTALRSD